MGRARKSPVVIQLRENGPTFMLLTGNEGLAGFALGIERVEVLFKALVARDPGVDGAPNRPTVRRLSGGIEH